METKKILILCFLGDPTCPSGSLSGTGGFNASVKDILDFIRNEKDFDCTVITNTTGNYNEPVAEQLGSNIKLYRIFSPANNLLHKNTFAKEIEKYISETEKIMQDFSTITFIHSFYWLSGMIAAELSAKYNLPFIHTTVSLAKQKLLSGCKLEIESQLEYEKIFLNTAKYVLAITEDEKRILLQEYDVPESKIIIEGQTVANAFHLPIYDSYGIPAELSYKEEPLKPIGFRELEISDGLWWNSGAFTYVGRITSIKGIDIIIKAWIELDKRFEKAIPPLWIIGNTPFEIEKFRRTLDIPRNLLEEYEATRRIIWWGYLTPTAISTLYLKTSVLITHSAFEAGGRVIIEALCQGIPVISTNTGFGKDYITNWVNGFIVEYGNIEMLMLRMSHFVMNPMISSVLGKNARRTFQKIERNWSHKIRIIKLYESLFSGKIYSDSYVQNWTLENNAFEKGIVETYPYYYNKPTIQKVMKFINSYIKEDVRIIPEHCQEMELHDIWIIKQKYVIKSIYPKLNKLKVWNRGESIDVWSVTEIVNKVLFISTFSVILTPIKLCKENNLILFPFIHIFSIEEIIKNQYAISCCLKKLSDFPINESKEEMTLSSCWRNLIQDIFRLNISEILRLYEMLPMTIIDYMSGSSHFTGKICIQYAQQLLGHVGIYKENIFLLPTYHWVYAQPGLDAGILFEETLNSIHLLKIPEVIDVLNIISEIFEVPRTQILAWSLCICLKKMINNIVFQNEKTILDTSNYLYLIEIFKVLI